MPNGFRFTLTASRYTSGAHTFQKPFKIDLPEDHSKVAFFRNAPCFKEEKVFIPDAVPQPLNQVVKGFPLSEVEGLQKKWVTALEGAGISTVERLLSEEVEFEDLTAISGIGKSTAEKIVEICEAVDLEPKDEEDEEDEDSD